MADTMKFLTQTSEDFEKPDRRVSKDHFLAKDDVADRVIERVKDANIKRGVMFAGKLTRGSVLIQLRKVFLG